MKEIQVVLLIIAAFGLYFDRTDIHELSLLTGAAIGFFGKNVGT